VYQHEQTRTESVASGLTAAKIRPAKPWWRVAALAAASALAGGVAAAWYYRTTLKTLQDAQMAIPDTEYDIPEGEADFEI
jgi:hypothetical protein